MTHDPADEIAALRAHLAALQSRLDALEGAPSPAAAEPAPRRVSRRGLLAAAVAGGAGLVATQVTTAAPAAAAPGNNVVLGTSNDGGTTTTTVTSAPSSFTAALQVNSTSAQGNGIQGTSVSGWGVDARSTNGSGLSAQSSNGAAVDAYSQNGSYCVYAKAATGVGVAAFSDGSGAGVRAQSAVAGPGVIGLSKFGYGLHGQSANGVAVRAEAGTDPTGSNAGPGTHAVDATSVNGYGVQTAGGIAPLRLVPSTKKGPPTTGSHQIGELWVDSAGSLFVCSVAGTPGTWKKVKYV